MADTLEKDLDLDTEPSEKESRIKELSNKVKLTAKERDEKDALLKQKDVELEGIKKEKSFYESFSDVSGQYPNAKEYKDAIKAKVLAGYSVEDATVSVLAKEGKLTTQPQKVDKTEHAGGSASTTITQPQKKGIQEMSQEEKRNALAESLTWS